MPTITIFKQDLEGLLAGPGKAPQTVTMEQLEESLMLVKGELKGQNPDTGELRIELQDSNRPDLWCCEGIARQIRVKRQGSLGKYNFLTTKSHSLNRRLNVAPGLGTSVHRGMEFLLPPIAFFLLQDRSKLRNGHKPMEGGVWLWCSDYRSATS